MKVEKKPLSNVSNKETTLPSANKDSVQVNENITISDKINVDLKNVETVAGVTNMEITK